jgi:hypothetical protein
MGVLNRPNSTRGGVGSNGLAGFANRIQAFCDSGDTFCDKGLSIAVHSTYLNRHQDDAAAFVLDKVGG